MVKPVLEIRNITQSFDQGDAHLEVLRGVNLTLQKGEVVALLGPSGSGKSTLLHIAGLLEAPDGGQVLLNGKDCITMSDGQRTRMRRDQFGFVYQFHHLLPEFTALENITLPQMIAGTGRGTADLRSKELLSNLGLAERLHHQPMQLSGGEQQRVAIARALANRPKVLLADEPTGNLDPKTADSVFDSLMSLVNKEGLSAIIATHNMDLARSMSRVVRLENGVLVEG